MQFNNAPAPLTLRANRLRITPRGAASSGSRPTVSRPTPAASRPTRLDRRRRAIRCADRGRTTGWFVVQDEASQLVALLAGERPGAARARYLRVAWRQDDGAGRGHGRARPARRLRRARSPHRRCCAGRSRRRGAANVAHRAGRPAGAAAVSRAVRLRPRRRALLGPRHAAPRSRHPLAAAAKPTSPPLAAAQLTMLRHAAGGRRAGRAARLRDLLERAGGERSGRRRVPRRGARRSPPSTRGRCTRCSADTVVDARGHLRTDAASPRARGVLRRGASNATSLSRHLQVRLDDRL